MTLYQDGTFLLGSGNPCPTVDFSKGQTGPFDIANRRDTGSCFILQSPPSLSSWSSQSCSDIVKSGLRFESLCQKPRTYGPLASHANRGLFVCLRVCASGWALGWAKSRNSYGRTASES